MTMDTDNNRVLRAWHYAFGATRSAYEEQGSLVMSWFNDFEVSATGALIALMTDGSRVPMSSALVSTMELYPESTIERMSAFCKELTVK